MAQTTDPIFSGLSRRSTKAIALRAIRASRETGVVVRVPAHLATQALAERLEFAAFRAFGRTVAARGGVQFCDGQAAWTVEVPGLRVEDVCVNRAVF